jgi:hypothetical protein
MKKRTIIEENSGVEVPYLPAGNWQVLRPCLVCCRTVRVGSPFCDYGNWTNLPGMELEFRMPRPEGDKLKPGEIWVLFGLQLSVERTWVEFKTVTAQEAGLDTDTPKETQCRIRVRLEGATSDPPLTLPASSQPAPFQMDKLVQMKVPLGEHMVWADAQFRRNTNPMVSKVSGDLQLRTYAFWGKSV